MKTKRLFVALMLVGCMGAMLGLYAAEKASAWAPTPIHQATLCDHETNGTEWGFVLTQMAEANAPASIHVTWTGGITADIPLTFYSGSGATGVAHYVTALHLDLKVIAATVQIDFVWDGNFNLSHGPACSVVTTTVTYPSTTVTTAPSTTVTTQPTTTVTTGPTTTQPVTTVTTVPEVTTTQPNSPTTTGKTDIGTPTSTVAPAAPVPVTPHFTG